MKSLLSAIVLAAAALPGFASPSSYDPEVDFDRPGHVPFHSVSASEQPPSRAVASPFDPAVDADRPGRVPIHAVSLPRAAPVRSASFNPEVDADRDFVNTTRPGQGAVAGKRTGHPD
jgi:hypothetical protein